jgi:hypothetical protein
MEKVKDGASVARDKIVIFSDESDICGKKYSYFLGSLHFDLKDFYYIENYLLNVKNDYPGELKWNKINNSKWKIDIYKNFINATFDLIEAGYLKCRISFVPNVYTEAYPDEEMSYFTLYSLFIIKNFSHYTGKIEQINLDRLASQNHAKINKFKQNLKGLNIQPSQIVEIDSSKHLVLQAIDIILGGINAKLNDKFAEKKENTNRRGKTTIIKEKIYKEINRRIRKLTPVDFYKNFNIGITTGGLRSSRFINDKYRHYQYRATTPTDLHQ